MKKYLIGLIFVALSIAASAQVQKFQVNQYCSRENRSQGWTEFTDWTPLKALVIMDSNKDKIIFYLSPEEEYYIYRTIPAKTIDGYTYLRMFAIDQNGSKCNLVVIKRLSDEERFITVEYSNVEYMYHLEDI